MHSHPLPENRPNSARMMAAGLPPVVAVTRPLPCPRPADPAAVVLNRLIALRADVARLQAAIATHPSLRGVLWRDLECCRVLLDSSIVDAAEERGGRDDE